MTVNPVASLLINLSQEILETPLKNRQKRRRWMITREWRTRFPCSSSTELARQARNECDPHTKLPSPPCKSFKGTLSFYYASKLLNNHKILVPQTIDFSCKAGLLLTSTEYKRQCEQLKAFYYIFRIIYEFVKFLFLQNREMNEFIYRKIWKSYKNFVYWRNFVLKALINFLISDSRIAGSSYLRSI